MLLMLPPKRITDYGRPLNLWTCAESSSDTKTFIFSHVSCVTCHLYPDQHSIQLKLLARAQEAWFLIIAMETELIIKFDL